MRVLGTLEDEAREKPLRAIAWDDKQPAAVRAAAISYIKADAKDAEMLFALAEVGEPSMRRAVVPLLQTMTLNDEQKKAFEKASLVRGHKMANRPQYTDIAGWKKFLANVPGPPDPARGREVFLSPRIGTCTMCHRVEAIGSIAGPNLSTIGAAKDPDYILESILQPSLSVAPQYEAFLLTTIDGQTRLAFELAEHGDRHTYIGIERKPFDVQMGDIVKRERLPMSIMPEGLVGNLTDEEIRDLIAFLKSRK